MFEAMDARTIRYGLGAVKGVGRGACEAIADARARGGDFGDLLEFCKRVDSTKLNRRALEALINAGALDALGRNRPSLMLQLPEVLKATEQLAREREAGQVSLFGGAARPRPELHIELPEARRLAAAAEAAGRARHARPLPQRASAGSVSRRTARAGRPRPRRPRPPVGRASGKRTARLAPGSDRDRRRPGHRACASAATARPSCSSRTDAGASNARSSPRPTSSSRTLLTRDRILVVEGGLREDEFSGGFSLRARRCWDYVQVCAPARAEAVGEAGPARARCARRSSRASCRAIPAARRCCWKRSPAPRVGRLELNGGQGVRDGRRAARAAAQPARGASGEGGDREALGPGLAVPAADPAPVFPPARRRRRHDPFIRFPAAR